MKNLVIIPFFFILLSCDQRLNSGRVRNLGWPSSMPSSAYSCDMQARALKLSFIGEFWFDFPKLWTHLDVCVCISLDDPRVNHQDYFQKFPCAWSSWTDCVYRSEVLRIPPSNKAISTHPDRLPKGISTFQPVTGSTEVGLWWCHCAGEGVFLWQSP